MNYEQLSVDILNAVGGVSNIKTVSHCMTRLRISCVDENKIQKDTIKTIEGVQGLVDRGYEIQIVIGTDVHDVYNAFNSLVEKERKGSSSETKVEESPKKKKKINPIDIFLKYVGGSVISTFPILCCAAAMSAVSLILTMFFNVSTESGVYVVFYTIYQGFFDYMPIFIGLGAAKILGMQPLYGGFLGALLCHPNFNGVEGLEFLGLAVPTVSYGSTIFPVLLGAAFMALVDRYIGAKVPGAISLIFRPLIVFAISVPITLLFLAPIGSIIGVYIAQFVAWLSETFGIFAVIIMGFLSPLMAATGTGNSLLPIFIQSYTELGYESFMFPTALGQNLAIGGAVLAIALKTRSKKRKNQGLSTGITACCGITEPALFGMALPLKKPFIAVLIGSTLDGLVAGLMNVKMFGVTPPGLIALPLFMNPDGSWGNLIGALLIVFVSFTAAFIATWVLGFDDEVETDDIQ